MSQGKKIEYKPEYADLLVEYMRDGKHMIQVCSRLEIGVTKFYEWVKEYPDFADAFQRGKAHSCNWWLELNRKAAQESPKDYNATLIIVNTRNRMPNFDKPVETEEVQTDSLKDIASHLPD